MLFQDICTLNRTLETMHNVVVSEPLKMHFPENKIGVICLMCLQTLEQCHLDEVLLQLIMTIMRVITRITRFTLEYLINRGI